MYQFDSLPQAQPEPIFAIAAKAAQAGPEALDGTIGILMGDDGAPLIFECVRSATEDVFDAFDDTQRIYPPLLGLPAFREHATNLIFGESPPEIASIAAAGGTGALSVNLRLAKLMGIETVILPTPSWANHPRLIKGANLKLIEAPDELLESIRSEKKPHLILLQAGCHNPTGRDFSADLWRVIAETITGTPHTVLLDTAYQGLGRGLSEDVEPIQILKNAGIPLLISWSASKNHSLYSFRTGLACAVTPDAKQKALVERHYGLIGRTMYSVAPTMGQHILVRVQEEYANTWRAELEAAKMMLDQKRIEMKKNLHESWHTHIDGDGMFTQLPLSADQVESLQKQNVFLTLDGRVNISGIPSERIPEFCKKILSCVG